MSQLVPAQASGGPSYQWKQTPTGSTAQFRGLAAVSKDVAWVGGPKGRCCGPSMAGSTGRTSAHPVPAHCSSATSRRSTRSGQLVLSIGTGEDSRIYRTVNGGKSWTETFRNTDPNAFYDCFAFNDNKHGLALSDPVDGKFRIAATSDGGKSLEGPVERRDACRAAR